jgi:hypothetical protein
MPDNFLNAAGHFGEKFFKTLIYEQERQDKLKEQQQEFSQRSRQMNLMEAYKNKVFELQSQNQAMDQQKTEYDILKDYDVSTDSLSKVGSSGTELNKGFGGSLLRPFQDDKYYSLKQKETAGNDLWEPINTNTIDPETKRPASLMRNKQDGTERYVENYKEKPSGSDGKDSDPKDSDPTGFKNKYEIDAFNRLRNPGISTKNEFGMEIYPESPEQKDADFNIIMNAKLTPNAMRFVNDLRGGVGNYPSIQEIYNAMDSATGLDDKDEQSIENFLTQYQQVEPTLRVPNKIKKEYQSPR